MSDQRRREGTTAGVAGQPLDRVTGIDEHDPIHRAARELVRALIETRWSLEAAAVVVGLRRLCETVEGKEIDALLGTWQFRERIGQAAPAFAPRLLSHDRIDSPAGVA